jgi:hypothetical protein
MEQITRGILINIVGMGSTLIGISTLVGLLVAKTLSNASVNPFMASAAAGYNPVLALDVFLVQVRHCSCLCCCIFVSVWDAVQCQRQSIYGQCNS